MDEMRDARGNEGNGSEGQPWVAPLQRMDAALAGRDGLSAELAWHEGCGAALRTESWEAMLAVGDAYRRIDAAADDVADDGADVLASQLYRSALARARRQESVEGLLRVAERLATLGDRAGMKQTLKIADHIAEQAQDMMGRFRVRTLKARLAGMAERVAAARERLAPSAA